MSGLCLTADAAQIADAMRARLMAAKSILIPTHINPDGDSLASVIALGRALAQLGLATVTVVSDAQVPPSLQFLLTDNAPIFLDDRPLPPTDLSLLVDITGLARTGPLLRKYADRLKPEVTLAIDHHVSNESFGAINLIDTSAAATAEILYLVLCRWGVTITPAIAAPLLTGILTDTLGFQTSSTTARTMAVATALVEAGAPLPELMDACFRTKPLSTARLFGAVVAAAQFRDGLLWSEVTPTMLAATGAQSGETEGAITYLSGVAEALIFALFYQQGNGGWRVSLRSRTDAINVSSLAARFGGGGHPRAAGCTISGGPTERQRLMDELLATIAAVSPSTP